jgi:hypothetical protein
MRGAVGKVSGAFFKMNDLYTKSHYVDYVACYNSIVQHIFEPNNDYSFDIFCHSWNQELEKEIRDLYSPVKASFEDNGRYNNYINNLCRSDTDFGGISQAITIKKSIELKEEYEKEHNFIYDIVIVYRYDVLLWKDMVLSTYTQIDKAIYVDAHTNAEGEFHFLMNSYNSGLFKELINSIPCGNHYRVHYWIKNYVTCFLHLPLLMDEIIPGRNLEAIRKIYEWSILPGHLSIEKFISYKGHPRR